MAVRGPALTGTLHDLALPDLLRMLASGRKSGVVELHGPSSGLVAFDEGDITIAVSDNGPTLQQVMIGSGLATADVWDEARRATDQGTSLVDALLLRGVDTAALRRVLYDQTVGSVFELILPSDASFEFRADEAHMIGTVFKFGVDHVLEDASVRLEAWKNIAEVIPTTSLVMRLVRDISNPDVTISADEWHVLSRVDGRATIADIIRELGMSAFAVCAVLHRLVGLGVVEPTEPIG